MSIASTKWPSFCRVGGLVATITGDAESIGTDGAAGSDAEAGERRPLVTGRQGTAQRDIRVGRTVEAIREAVPNQIVGANHQIVCREVAPGARHGRAGGGAIRLRTIIQGTGDAAILLHG